MKKADFQKIYVEQTEIVSELSRKLGFAGIAFLWVLREDDGGLPPDLRMCALLLVLALACDLLQYVVTALLYQRQAKKHQLGQQGQDFDIPAPRSLNDPGRALFITKAALIIAAYMRLVWFLWPMLMT